MTPRPLRGAGLARLVGLALLWGTAFLGIKVAATSFSPPTVTAIRAALGAALLLGVLAARCQRFPPRATWPALLVVAVTGIAVPYTLFAFASRLIPSGLGGAINSATPLFTLLVGLLMGHTNRPTRRQVAGLAVGFAGTVVMMRPWDAQGSLLGAGLAVAAAALYGVTYNYQAAHVSGKAAPTSLAAAQLLFAVPAAVLAVPLAGPPVSRVTATTAGALLVLGVLSTGVAYLLNYQMIEADGPLLASTVTYLIPVVALTAGALLGHEVPTLTTLVGVVITLSGVLLTRLD